MKTIFGTRASEIRSPLFTFSICNKVTPFTLGRLFGLSLRYMQRGFKLPYLKIGSWPTGSVPKGLGLIRRIHAPASAGDSLKRLPLRCPVFLSLLVNNSILYYIKVMEPEIIFSQDSTIEQLKP